MALIKEWLGEKYDFKTYIKEYSRNPDDLIAARHVRILPPMSSRVPAALLAAMESVFASKVQEQDASKAIKRRWPGKWVRTPRKKTIPNLGIPLIWGAKYFGEGGLSLPPTLAQPVRSTVARSFAQIEGQIAVLQRGIKSASSVSLALEALKEAVRAEGNLRPQFSKALNTLLAFAAYANYHSMTMPFQLLVSDTASLRELTLQVNGITNREPDYASFMTAPFVNTSLFPGCASALTKTKARLTRAHSYYSRQYKNRSFPMASNSRRWNTTERNKRFGKKFQPSQAQQQQHQYQTFQKSFYQMRQKQGQGNRGAGQQRPNRGRYNSAPASLPTAPSSLPEALLGDIRERESEPVGACLKGKQVLWAEVGASSWLQSLLRVGYSPTLVTKPCLTTKPPFVQHSPEKTFQLSTIVNRLLSERAVVRIDSPQSNPGFYSYFFVRPKKTGGLRPIFNMKPLNKYVRKETFRMETPLIIAESIEPEAWACSLDLSDAYLHIPMHESVQKYLRFTHDNEVFQFQSLPFGLNVSAWVFTKVASAVVSRLHQQGIAVSAYIDDWLIHHKSPAELQRHRDLVVTLLLKLGWHVNESKSAFTPSQSFTYLGVNFNTKMGILSNTAEKAEEVAKLASLLEESGTTTPKFLRSLIGKLTFVMHYVKFGKANTRPLQWLLKRIWDKRDVSLNIKRKVVLNTSLRQALSNWRNEAWIQSGIHMHAQQPDFTLHTDASASGWGAVLSETTRDRQVKTFSGTWSKEVSECHSNVRELLAVFCAIQAVDPKQVYIKLFSDNTSVVAIINRQGTVLSLEMQRVAQRLFDSLQERDTLVTAAHIPGNQNLQADILSRPDKIFATEWKLDSTTFRKICQHFNFKPRIDAFATALTAQLPIYFSPVPDEGAAGLDAFAQSWDGWDMYLFPPFSLYAQVISKLRRSQGTTALIIYPQQPRKPWFPGLQALMITQPFQLPRIQHVLTQSHSKVRHPALKILNLHAVLCKSKISGQQV
jgi:hypothetical protein